MVFRNVIRTFSPLVFSDAVYMQFYLTFVNGLWTVVSHAHCSHTHTCARTHTAIDGVGNCAARAWKCNLSKLVVVAAYKIDCVPHNPFWSCEWTRKENTKKKEKIALADCVCMMFRLMLMVVIAKSEVYCNTVAYKFAQSDRDVIQIAPSRRNGAKWV